jgi:hypothetical protein
VLLAGAAALALSKGPRDSAALALAIGLGLCAAAPNVVRSARVRAALLLALLTGFVAIRLGTLFASSSVSVGSVLRLLTEGLLIAVVYDLVHARAHGLAQLSALFSDRDAGYAPVVDEESAARSVEAELSRSRRHGSPLTFLVLEPVAATAGPAFDAAVRRLSPGAIAELERLYRQRRGCRVISEQVRRSDVVVCSTGDRFLVMSTDTSAAGTELLANRLIDAVRAEVGIELRPGIAEFPAHGSTYGDLIAVATAAAVAPAAEKPVLAAVVNDSTVPDPTVLDPTVLDPTVLDPTVLDPTVLEPTVLDPTVIPRVKANP